jgi:asparaginyl-tRNA synthetase
MKSKKRCYKDLSSLELLKKRYQILKHPQMVSVLKIQDEILSSIRDFLRSEGLVEILPPIIGPATDPGIRGAKQVTIDYYGTPFKIMSSMILYKQMAIMALGKVFAVSPNIRLESIETLKTGRHLTEFRQVDLELVKADYMDAMALAERLVHYICKKIKRKCKSELEFIGRELKVPKMPFKKITYKEAIELLISDGYDLNYEEEIPWDMEEKLSKMHGDPFFIYDFPKTARGFYDREDPKRLGILRDFDLIYPDGFGEAISGGEREHTLEKIVDRMKSTGEDPKEYQWYLEMLKDGVPLSAGFGIGVERLTRYICGLKTVWEAVPFPKVAGVISS